MKIAYFVAGFEEDGVTRVIIALIREAQKNGIECIVVTGGASNPKLCPVPLVIVPSMKLPLYKTYRLSWPIIRGFKKQLDEFKPDIIHINSPDTIAWAALKYAKRNHVPIVATYHTDFMTYLAYYHLEMFKPLAKYLIKKLYSQMNITTTPSAVTMKYLTDYHIKNVYNIPWAVELSAFNTSFRSQKWRDKILKGKNIKIIICVCRLTWEKELRTLAKTYDLLRNSRDDFVMVIAGDGPARKELESLMPGAIFLGHLRKKHLSIAYASSDIFLFPSISETFGNVTIEAMASGIVPVVANAGGSKTIVKDNENGFLAKPKNPDDFFKKVNILLDNPQITEKMRKNGINYVKTFSWEKVFEEILKIYQSQLKPSIKN